MREQEDDGYWGDDRYKEAVQKPFNNDAIIKWILTLKKSADKDALMQVRGIREKDIQDYIERQRKEREGVQKKTEEVIQNPRKPRMFE